MYCGIFKFLHINLHKFEVEYFIVRSLVFISSSWGFTYNKYKKYTWKARGGVCQEEEFFPCDVATLVFRYKNDIVPWTKFVKQAVCELLDRGTAQAAAGW